MPVSPNSFSITAIFSPCCSVRMRLRSVVFPAPRKPVRMVTGMRSLSAAGLHGSVGGGRGRVERVQDLGDGGFFKVAGDEDQPRPAVIIRPFGELCRGIERMLDRVTARRCRLAGHVHEPLQAQDALAAQRRARVSRAVARASQSTGRSLVHVKLRMRASWGPRRRRCGASPVAGAEPARSRRRARRARCRPVSKSQRGVERAQRGAQQRRGGIERARARASSASIVGGRCAVALGDHQAVGHRHLLHRLGVLVERARAVLAVDRRSPRRRARSGRRPAASRPAWPAAGAGSARPGGLDHRAPECAAPRSPRA